VRHTSSNIKYELRNNIRKNIIYQVYPRTIASIKSISGNVFEALELETGFEDFKSK